MGKIKILERALLRCKSQDITIVVAAGNEGRLHNLDEYVPQEFGNDDRFEMITVGGVDREGKYYKHTVNSRGQGGEVNLYAGAVDVVGADANGKDNLASRTDTGSSLAAPAVVCFPISTSTIHDVIYRLTIIRPDLLRTSSVFPS